MSGYRQQVEQKYFTRTTATERRYFSAGLSYGETELTEKTHYYDHINQLGFSDTFSISRKNASFNLKLGRQYYAGRFVFDMAIGPGIKHRRVTHQGRSIPYGSRHPNIIVSANDERNEITLNLPATFKIGYRF